MKKIERVKSFLLAFLVLITIYLVQELWVEVPTSLTPLVYGQDPDNTKEFVLSDFILPEKCVINFGSEKAIIYSNDGHNLWDKGKEILKSVFQSKDIVITELSYDDMKENNKKRFVNFYFSDKINTFIFGRMLDIEIPFSIGEKINKVNTINIYIDTLRDSFIVLSDGINHYKISEADLDISGIKEEIDIISESDYTRAYTVTELLGTDGENNLFIPFQMNYNLPQVHVRQEIDLNIGLEEAEETSIAELFFDRDLAYIRRIEENDGSIIYVDSKRTLKLHKNGTLEFYKSSEESIEKPNLYLSLKNSIDFVSSHMGWPDDTYLYEINEISTEDKRGYKFTFKYKMDGLTVVSDESQLLTSIELELYNNQVSSYKRRVWKEIGTVKPKSSYKSMLSANDILHSKFNFITSKYVSNENVKIDDMSLEELDEEVKLAIKNAYLAYFDNSMDGNQILKPVWIIDVGSYSYIFDAYDGYEEVGGNPRQ